MKVVGLLGYHSSMKVFDIVFLVIYLIVFCFYVYLEFLSYRRERQKIALSRKDTTEKLDAYQSSKKDDYAINAIKDMLQQIKREQLEKKIDIESEKNI